MKKIHRFLIKFVSFFILDKEKRHDFRKKHFFSKIKYSNNNEIIFYKENGKIIKNPDFLPSGLSISFIGSNSKVVLHESSQFLNTNIYLRDNAYLEIGKNCKIRNLLVYEINNYNQLIIGNNFNCYGCQIRLHDGKNNFIKIGNDCMFSTDIDIWPHDGHPIYNKGTKEIINDPKDGVYVEDHVWICRGVNLLKNAYIPKNSVIGAYSVVNKNFKGRENVIIAGIPAKIIKENIEWSTFYDYQDKIIKL